ncbi:FosC2 family fosfomycin resistance glutathione transferase [Aliidiomarina shirensis]|uniref:FosC2 family fosfomycin resistance glutathione transferase n=1 Tax=Aliidiomarina shirensis TaxID=1048642 RepID=A0A432WUS0_9GAMM|nr:FosC2 family fosfomycin resistance glutathione transferase [Aliidiomarina shirensis]RUO37516.1 FosC2 family fosfomycin resistance glutathione transferase [Aliidiomarina shirensis]
MLRGINHITIAVSDLERSLEFYTRLLGMKAHVSWDSGAYLSLGATWICLSCDEVHPSQDYCHIAFDVSEENFEPVTKKLREAHVVEWKQNRSEGLSLYLLDPDGHKLEIHSGSLQSRLESLKSKPYQGLVWL